MQHSSVGFEFHTFVILALRHLGFMVRVKATLVAGVIRLLAVHGLGHDTAHKTAITEGNTMNSVEMLERGRKGHGSVLFRRR